MNSYLVWDPLNENEEHGSVHDAATAVEAAEAYAEADVSNGVIERYNPGTTPLHVRAVDTGELVRVRIEVDFEPIISGRRL